MVRKGPGKLGVILRRELTKGSALMSAYWIPRFKILRYLSFVSGAIPRMRITDQA
jgi:hypothetical protein